jgi:hypothetical protein
MSARYHAHSSLTLPATEAAAAAAAATPVLGIAVSTADVIMPVLVMLSGRGALTAASASEYERRLCARVRECTTLHTAHTHRDDRDVRDGRTLSHPIGRSLDERAAVVVGVVDDVDDAALADVLALTPVLLLLLVHNPAIDGDLLLPVLLLLLSSPD